ncbi:HEAT repeat domain-containing protein [Catenuloplanes indicus]|uniref:HEAT repeat protein n=1 Tax=Catenuloplanes indicus TaxID=137267 RepID=A0AAE3VY23_9ACTN|nr:HEAT repeat domain-containing protein [Catenuloplanes indicus]MDQ0365095.1 HEAT repeat protein [Catenuloplanes indicus]
MSAAIIVMACVLALLAVAVVIVRVVRRWRVRQRTRIAAGPRRLMLALIADPDPDGVEELARLPAVSWRAVEPTATALLGKVRGDAHTSLVTVFRRRGLADLALTELGARSHVRRARAAELLGNLRAADAVQGLCGLLDDPHAEVRLVAVRALGRIGDPAAAWRLLASLARAEPTSVQMVALALTQCGAGTEAALRAALDHRAPLVRITALDALGLLQSAARLTMQAIARLLLDDDVLEVRLAAAGSLGRLGSRDGVLPLSTVLANDEQPVALRAASARALGAIGAPAAVQTLTGALPDKAYRVAHECAHALRRCGPAGFTSLQAVAIDSPNDVGMHAREALASAAIERGEANHSF